MNLAEHLKQPFYFIESSKQKWQYILFTIIFSLLFLVLFRPFGLDYEFSNPENSIFTIIGFLLQITFSSGTGLLVSQFVFRPFLKFQKVTTGRYIIWYFIEVGLLTVMNLGYAFLFPDLGNDPIEEELNIAFQLGVYFQVFVILLFPFFGTIIYVLIQNLNLEIQDLETKIHGFQNMYHGSNSGREEFLEIFDENNHLELKIRIRDFLCAESSNQYVIIHYKKEAALKKQIIRTRLKQFLTASGNLPIAQCHRSYVINLLNIKTLIKRESKTYVVLEDPFIEKVPVSKSFIITIRENLDRLK